MRQHECLSSKHCNVRPKGVLAMLAQKTFYKKTRRGKILKIVREHYLRDDISCNSDLCSECSGHDENTNSGSRLEVKPKSSNSTFKKPHYLLLDTNVVLDQIDLLEASEPGLTNVIITQTVLEESRHRSSPVYKRLKDILMDRRRRFVTFINEHRQETYCSRQPGETANDRNDRAIRVACQWLQKEHWQNQIEVILITDDVDNRNKAKKDGLKATSIAAYVESMKNATALLDKLNRKEDKGDDKDKRFLFPEHLSPDQINSGIKTKKLLQGVFHLSRTNFLEGSVMCEGQDQPILIQGLEHQNRAVDGDQVALELFGEEKWSAPAQLILDDEGFDPGDNLEEDKSILKKAIKKKSEIQPTGKVVGIIKRKWRQYCGILQENPVKGSTRHLFIPAEKRIPKVRIETRQSQILKGQRIIVAIDAWPRHSRYPGGHFVRALGKIGDKATENEVLLLEHDIPHSKFSEAVLDCLPKLPWHITDKDLGERVDLRDKDICSVDPPGCTDIDDALHCLPLPNGNFEVGVHIADVSHFIRPGTELDKEAANRSTTVYLTDRRIDMVPELLSSNLCSLRGGVERFAFSCVWEMTSKAEIVKTVFHKSVIRSRKAMTYEEAQIKIDDPNDNDNVAKSLRQLMKLSKILKQRRHDKGALVLASSEIRFTVDSETADPVDVQEKVIRDTNSMVEEFMLAANISAAQRIFADFPDCAMLRRHPAPPPSNFDSLVKAGKVQGFTINVDTGKELAQSLDKAVIPDNPYFNTMLRMIATRCMMQAVYFASGTIEEPLFVHYGLACPIYTHFTSPIRRYADVIVHRLLAVSIMADQTYPELLDVKQTERIAQNINYRHRMAQYASRASVNLHTHLFFKDKTRHETGYILFIRQNAVQVLIPRYGLEGTLFLRDEGSRAKTHSVQFHFDESVPSQTAGDVTLRLFQKVQVQLSLDQSNVQHEKLIVRLVQPRIPGFSVEEETEEPMKEESKGQKRPALDSQTPSRSKKKTKRK